MRIYPVILLLLLNFLVTACDTGLQGNLNENQLPSTSLTLNEINLPEGKRLVSQVNISWWGDDPDGYVVGYEYFIGNPDTAAETDWRFTTQTDSTFILPIPEGNIDADVRFNIRAVDNDDARDDDPPFLVFPISNSLPEVDFVFNRTPPDTTYRVASIGFDVSDPDGRANLNRVEIALNDTSSEDSWKEIDIEVNFITLRIDDTIQNPVAEVMLGLSATPAEFQFNTAYTDQENTFYVRAIDNAAAVSEVVEYTWYVKKQTSRVLFLNDFFGSNTNSRGAFHLDLLAQNGITNVDYIDISDGEVVGGTRVRLSSALPDRSLGRPTINMMLAEWDYIYWISDDLDRNIGYALELTEDFVNQGGKIFINIPIEPLGARHPLYQFLPFQDVMSDPNIPGRSAQLRVPTCAEVSPYTTLESSLNLRVSRNIDVSNPIIPFENAIPLYKADYILRLNTPRPPETREYDEIETIAAMNEAKSLVYFGFDLTHFTMQDGYCEDPESGDALPSSNLEGLIDHLIIKTLGFEQ